MSRFIGESIRYPIRTTHDRDEMAPCIIAGPTCDSVDVLYERRPIRCRFHSPLTTRCRSRPAPTPPLIPRLAQRLSTAAAVRHLSFPFSGEVDHAGLAPFRAHARIARRLSIRRISPSGSADFRALFAEHEDRGSPEEGVRSAIAPRLPSPPSDCAIGCARRRRRYRCGCRSLAATTRTANPPRGKHQAIQLSNPSVIFFPGRLRPMKTMRLSRFSSLPHGRW